MKSIDYWKKREEEARKNYIKDEKIFQDKLNSYYEEMADEIQSEIDSFYAKYAASEGISIADAKRRVSKLDMEEYERKAERYVADSDFSDQANEEMRLYNLTMKVNRLEMLKARMNLALTKGYDNIDEEMRKLLDERAYQEFKRLGGILGDTVTDPEHAAETLVNGSFKNATFSERIWGNKTALQLKLEQMLTSGLIQGRNPRDYTADLKKIFGVGKYEAERLMRTEMARVQTEAQKQSFERNGYDEYVFLALGSACEICKDIDGKHFPVKDMMPGENAPPMHPNCRCSTAAYLPNGDENAIIKSLDMEDFSMLSDSAKLNPEISNTIATVIREFEKKGEMYISEVHFGRFFDAATGKEALLQTDVNQYGMVVLNVNSTYMQGRTLEEINSILKENDNILANNLCEAVVHECGHAKAYRGKRIPEIIQMNEELIGKGCQGISECALSDGAETIAEVEILLYRGESVPKDAMKLYRKYVNDTHR